MRLERIERRACRTSGVRRQDDALGIAVSTPAGGNSDPVDEALARVDDILARIDDVLAD